MEMRQELLPIQIDADFSSYTAERRQCLQTKMTEVANRARNQAVPDVSLEKGALRISPLKKNTPSSAVGDYAGRRQEGLIGKTHLDVAISDQWDGSLRMW